MAITFRKAVRENVHLVIGLVGTSGSGKTYSALEMAQGLAGGKPVCLIDTERGRGLHYANRFSYDYAAITEPFRPDTYADAIMAAESAGYGVIIVDSVSHVWAGPGGVLDWQEDELDRMAGDDWKKREACKMAAWIKPKMAHKAFVQRLLQVNSHLILCFRAEEKMGMSKDRNGKTQIISLGFQPICEKNIPYEMTLSLLFTDSDPGVPAPIKLNEDHKPLVSLSSKVDRKTGERLAEWAAGGGAVLGPVQKPTAAPSEPAAGTSPAAPSAAPKDRSKIVASFLRLGLGLEYIEGWLGEPLTEASDEKVAALLEHGKAVKAAMPQQGGS